MDIQDMCIFARVAAVQNLSAVGTELGLTPGTISKRIQALEEELCVRLFDRTTRSIRITEEGAKFLAHVERILSEIERARAAVSVNVEHPRGRLKISAPASLGRRFIGPAICAFMEHYPEIEVHIDLTDRPVNLHEEGYDVVIRTGALTDSNLIAKRLVPDRQIIVASPLYLEMHGRPRAPQDLAAHSCLVLGEGSQWAFCRDGRETSVRVTGRLRSNNGDLLCHAAVAGMGLMRASELCVSKQIEDGALCVVLPEHDVAAYSAIWALYPKTKHVLPKLRVFLDFMGDWFRDVRADLGDVEVEATAQVAFERGGRPSDLRQPGSATAARGNGGAR